VKLKNKIKNRWLLEIICITQPTLASLQPSQSASPPLSAATNHHSTTKMAEESEKINMVSNNLKAEETKQEQKAKQEEEEKEMKPWEQHSAVINMPRFNYKAPSSLLQTSHSGFLITCPIKREKSATKEAISIIEKHFGCLDSSHDSDCEDVDVAYEPKRRKTCLQNAEGESGGTADQSRGSESDPNMINKDTLSLVKLTRSGLVLFILLGDCPSAVTRIVSNIITSLETGTTKTPLWCHRIFPIQATCSLKEREVHTVVSRLVKQFVSDNKSELSKSVKFAVGYNRRGIEETEMNYRRTVSSESQECGLLDRSKCFSVVAGAVKEAIPDSVVDLKCPEICILIEVLPLSAVSDGSMIVAVSILPQKLVNLKPKLSIKALISDAKARNKK
ncbi:hypothetical protein Leryth_017445, partial [Lithospermum erythrorhizon]